MAEREYVSRIKTLIDGDVSKLTRELSKLEHSFKSFTGLKNSGLNKGFESALQNVRKIAKEYESLGNMPFTNSNELSKAQRVIRDMQKAMSDLSVEAARIKKQDVGELFNFDQNLPNKLKAMLDTMTTGVTKEVNDIQAKLKELGTLNMGKNTRVHVDKILGFDPKGTAEDIDEMYSRLVKARSAAESQLKKTTKDESKIALRQDEIEFFNKLIEKVVDIRGEYQDLEITFQRAYAEAEKVPLEELQKFEKAADGIADEVRGFGAAMEQAASDSVGLAKQTQALTSSFLSLFSLDKSVQIFQKIIRDAIGTIKELDAAMTETAVVTDFSVGDMWAKLPEYTARANELGATTKGVYETMTLLYQQGLDTNRVFEIGTEILQMARIAGLEYSHATDLSHWVFI